jgi:hypothetical protein
MHECLDGRGEGLFLHAVLFGADGRLPSAVYSELGCKMLSRSPAAVGERCENTVSDSLRMV